MKLAFAIPAILFLATPAFAAEPPPSVSLQTQIELMTSQATTVLYSLKAQVNQDQAEIADLKKQLAQAKASSTTAPPTTESK